MQFIKSVALPVAFVASISFTNAAPISEKRMAVGNEMRVIPSSGDLMTEYRKLYPNSKFIRDISEAPEKRLGWGKLAAGGAAAVVGWLTSKEGQDFLATDEGLDFVSKLAINDAEEETPEKRLNAAAMIGLTGGSVFKGIFGSKEGQEFLNSDEGLEFVSKLALNDDEEETPSKRLNAAAMIGLTGGSVLKGIFGSKEAADAFLATPEGEEFVSKLALDDDEASSLERRIIINGVDRTDKKPSAAAKVLTNLIYKATGWKKSSRSEDEETPSKRLNAAAMWGLTGGAVLKGIFGSKEGQEFLNSEEGQQFISKWASDETLPPVSSTPSKRLNAAAMIGLTGGSVLKGIFGSKEAEDFLNSSEGQEFISKLALDDESVPSKRSPLNAAAMIGLTGGSVLKGIFGSKEAADEFLASKEGEEFASELLSSKREVSHPDLDILGL